MKSWTFKRAQRWPSQRCIVSTLERWSAAKAPHCFHIFFRSYEHGGFSHSRCPVPGIPYSPPQLVRTYQRYALSFTHAAPHQARPPHFPHGESCTDPLGWASLQRCSYYHSFGCNQSSRRADFDLEIQGVDAQSERIHPHLYELARPGRPVNLRLASLGMGSLNTNKISSEVCICCRSFSPRF
jgi:hypothetical protein